MNFAQHILIGSIRLYRLVISPAQSAIFGPLAGCRYAPTCSVYAIEAIQKHGVLKGNILAGKRLCRCHPWGGCGDDPVPEQYRIRIPGIKFLHVKFLHNLGHGS